VLVVAIIIWAVRNIPAAVQDNGVEHMKTTTYKDNVLTEEKDGRTLWKLAAGSIEVDAANKNAELSDVDGTYYAEDGRVVELKAAHGSYDGQKHDFKLDGDDGIKVNISDGTELTSQELDWTDADGILAAVGKAELTKEADDLQATGDRIESSDGFSKIKIKGSDKGQAHISRGK
jgi:hypothetical protein